MNANKLEGGGGAIKKKKTHTPHTDKSKAK